MKYNEPFAWMKKSPYGFPQANWDDAKCLLWLGCLASSCSSCHQPFPRVTRFSSRSARGRRMMGW